MSKTKTNSKKNDGMIFLCSWATLEKGYIKFLSMLEKGDKITKQIEDVTEELRIIQSRLFLLK
jgi:hypothetical protein